MNVRKISNKNIDFQELNFFDTKFYFLIPIYFKPNTFDILNSDYLI